MSDAIWNCEASGVPSDGLTVGQIFDLKCSGGAVAGLSVQSLGLELAKPDRYRLKVVSAKSANESGVHLLVTSYQTGENKLENVVLTDGLVRISLSGIQFEVRSVLSPLEQDPKPFPPHPPVSLMWPTEVIVLIASLVFALIGLTFRVYFLRKKRAEFQAWLSGHRTPLSPIDQLNKELRRVAKERNPSTQVIELEKVLREYLARELREPVLNASPKIILKRASGGDRRVKEKLQPLTARVFGEFDRLQVGLNKKTIDATEALSKTLPELLEMSRELAVAVNSRGKLRGAK
jgi:hypothetical protein